MQEINTNMTATQMAAAINENFGGGSDYTNKVILPNLYEKSIKVLAIGNSFTYWPLLAFGAVVNLTGKATSLYNLQTVCSSGTGLDGFCSGFSSSGTVGMHKHFGEALSDIGTSASIKSALNGRNWDAVVFQQLSGDAIDYTTYKPYLNALINAVRRYSANPAVQVGWHMIWDKNHYAETQHRAAILENSRKVMDDFDIDFVVPTGTAFENAWAAGQMTSKSAHFDGSGHTTSAESQFLASATWYQTLYKALLGKDIVTAMTAELNEPVTWDGHNSAEMSASAEYCKIAAKCAKAAVDEMWNVTTIE